MRRAAAPLATAMREQIHGSLRCVERSTTWRAPFRAGNAARPHDGAICEQIGGSAHRDGQPLPGIECLVYIVICARSIFVALFDSYRSSGRACAQIQALTPIRKLPDRVSHNDYIHSVVRLLTPFI